MAVAEQKKITKAGNPAREGRLDMAVQFVPGVGPQRSRQLEKLDLRTVEDLLYYLPRRYLDRSLIVPIDQLELSDQEVTVIGKVTSTKLIGGGPNSQRLEVNLADGTGLLKGVWFQGLSYWSKTFQRGQLVAFSGKVRVYRDQVQITHPAVDFLDDAERQELKAKTGAIVAQYSSGEELARMGLDSRGFRRIMAEAVTLAREHIPEILPAEFLDKYKFLTRTEALFQIHFPKSLSEVHPALHRLKYEEIFLLQLSLGLRLYRRKNRQPGIHFPHPKPGGLTAKAVKRFPFELTKGQLAVLTDIRQDMESEFPMNRLLQGDVGAGKTAVVMLALAMAVEGGYQGAVMVPTEVLAEQHFRTLEPFFGDLGVKVTLLIGGLSSPVRRERLAALSNGTAQIAIGTHALIQEGVEFARLGLAVIDEQHRFGVAQRLELRRKGAAPDVLVLTATPIPRSLALTLYGDLDVSLLKERPGHRLPIQTGIMSGKEQERLIDWIKKELHKGRQGFIIYPLVEASEKLDLQAAVDGYKKLKSGPLHEFRLGLLHGRLPSEEKEQVMVAFARGEYDLLVSTSVVEVGIDVPNATAMVIMGAQRFGLSQLHQLRGRVGRGQHRGVCVLVVDPPMTKEAKDRLNVLVRTEDGFVIAEEDLRIRGGGEFFGTRQSGAPDFKIADPVQDRELLETARADAFALVKRDPDLKSHPPLRAHFERVYGKKLELMDVG